MLEHTQLAYDPSRHGADPSRRFPGEARSAETCIRGARRLQVVIAAYDSEAVGVASHMPAACGYQPAPARQARPICRSICGYTINCRNGLIAAM